MMTFLVYIISFGHLLFSPVISVTFGDYRLTGGMFSDVSGQGPLLEPGTSQSNGLVPQGIKEVQEDSDHCIYLNPELINDLDNIFPDHYYMLDFFESHNFPPSQESRAQPKEMSTTQTSMQVSLPIEEPLSTQRSERNLEMTHQPGQTESLISPKKKSKQSGTKLTSLSLTNSENPRKRKSRSQFHEEKEIKKQIQSKHDQNYYYSVYEKTINSALQWQCRLLLSKRYKISEEIETFFKKIQRSYRSSFNNFLDGSDSDIINQVSIAIERIRTEFVMGVLGTFKILFQRNIKSELMDYLIFDLWEYLQIYLIREFSLRPEEINPKPVKSQRNSNYTYIGARKLLQYTLELSISYSIHSRFIHKMLQEWADTTSFKDHVLGITSDYWLFVEECDILFKQKGEEKTIYTAKEKNKARITNDKDSRGKKRANKTKSPVSKLSTFSFVAFLQTEGAHLANRDEFVKFFSNLHDTVKSISKAGTKVKKDLEGLYQGEEILSKEMVRQAIHTAQNELTPAFLGLLRLMHPETTHDSTWDVISHSGWEFLKEYFSIWIKYLAEANFPIILKTPIKRVKVNEEYCDLKETMKHLSRNRNGHPVYLGLIWFLADLWYDQMIHPEIYGKEPPGFKFHPPHREYLLQKGSQMQGGK